MKRKKWRGAAGAAAVLCAAVIGLFPLSTRAEKITEEFVFRSLDYEKSSETLKVTAGNDSFVYIGDNDETKTVGQYVDFSFRLEEAGTYDLDLITKKHENKGVFQVSVNGEEIGEPYDQYGSGGQVTADFGQVTFDAAGDQTLRIQVLEPNPKSGSCQVAVKGFELSREMEEEIPDVDFGESIVSESGNVISYPLPYIYKQSETFQVTADGLTIPVISYRGEYDYGEFSMSGQEDGGDGVTVEIAYKEPVKSYEISPRNLDIQAETDGNKLTFTLENHQYLIIRINGGKRLVLAADPMETEVPEKAGEGIYNILEEPYHAERTGTKSSTKAIQKAIDDASAYGTEKGDGTRGVVYIPVGVYKTGSLVLKSNVEIYLEGGAVLRASLDESEYVVRGNKNSIGKDVVHLIYTENNKISDPYSEEFHNPENYIESDNMKIYGRGTIDARGRDLEKEANLLSQSIIPMNCSNFAADGLTIRDTGVWSVAPGLSNDLQFTNLKILNTMNHEDDCIDINGCQDVVVKNVVGVALDDPFSTKTWETGELFQAWCGEPEPCENILFEDCLSWSYCYGFKVGQGSWRDQSQIVFRDSTVYDCAVGLGVHHKYGTASLSDITFENIDIEHITNTNDSHRTWLHMQAITGGTDQNLPISDVKIRNIHVYDKGTSTAKLVGFSKEYGISGIQMENIYMEDLGRNANNLEELDIKDLYVYCNDVTLDGKQLPDSPEVFIWQLEDKIDEAFLSENCPDLGRGEGYVYIGNKVGDWASFPVEIEAGTYKLEIMMKKHETKGIFQMYLDDEKIGDPVDQYYKGNKTGVTVNYGTVTFPEDGVHNFKFEITGKNESSGGYAIVLDAIKLTETESALEKIAITSLPEKLEYVLGEEADYSGLEVTAYYEDGTEKVLSEEEYTVNGFQSQNPGTATVEVSYKDKKTSFKVEIKVPEDLEGQMDYLTRKIASASNAEEIHEAMDETVDFVNGQEKVTDYIFDLLVKAEQALLKLDDHITATKKEISEDVVREYGMKKSSVKVEGAAVTAGQIASEEVVASPSNAVMRMDIPETKPNISQEFDRESAAALEIVFDVELGDLLLDHIDLAAPVRISFPIPKRFHQEDQLTLLLFDEDGELLNRVEFVTDGNKISFITQEQGIFVLMKQAESENPDGEKPDPEPEPQPVRQTRSSGGITRLQTTPGRWMQDEIGWWYQLEDGNYPKSDWIISKGIWYYFDENGYMYKGWVQWNGKWYYLNPDGSCAVSTVTPDGYLVDPSGAWIRQQ
ncbi:MAG TPA: bacterial Ig-like domain-containing protein [Candidatus Hungatella pullicola]|nr:bacterial Ig-like domain-containing protein [Candidatus Hungatella pullicola]